MRQSVIVMRQSVIVMRQSVIVMRQSVIVSPRKPSNSLCFRGSKKLLKYLKYLKRENHIFHEKLPMFSLKLNFFDFTSLRQGQFLANDGEKAEKSRF